MLADMADEGQKGIIQEYKAAAADHDNIPRDAGVSLFFQFNHDHALIV